MPVFFSFRAAVVVKWLAELGHDHEALGSIPAAPKLFFQKFAVRNVLGITALRKRI